MRGLRLLPFLFFLGVLNLAARPPEGDNPLTFAVYPAADSMKFVVTGASGFTHTVNKSGGSVSIAFSGGRLENVSQQYKSGLVTAVNGGGGALTLTAGAGFQDVRTYMLRNPDRLVIQVIGDDSVRPEERLTPEAGTPAAPESPEGTAPPAEVKKPVEVDAALAARNPFREKKKDGRVRTVVLDPGHGGADEGARRGDQAEKAITLAIAKDLKTRLEKDLDLNVLLTRSGDTSVGLADRTSMANYNGADLFVSIHINSSKAPASHGSETFFLSLEASDQASAEAATRENAGAGGDMEFILWDMAQRQYMAESAFLAEVIQKNLNTLHKIADRGVKQAPFVVLKGVEAPAVLVEVAFLSNPAEAKLLATDEFRTQVVDSLTRSIKEFKDLAEGATP